MSNSMLQGFSYVLPPQIVPFQNANWCVCPAYSFGKYSALLFLKEADIRNSNLDSWPFYDTLGDFAKRSVIVRGVRDDDTGEIVAISNEQDSEHAFCMVMRNDHITGKRRMRSFFRCNISALRSSWRKPEGIAVSVPYLVKMDEQATCASCFGPCTCILPPMVRAQHPLDFSHVRQNMMRQVGTFTCTGNTIQLRDGQVVVRRADCTMLGEMSGGNAPGTVSRLLNWAISRSLAFALSAAAPTRAPLPIALVQSAYQAMRDASAIVETPASTNNSFSTVPAITSNDCSSVLPFDALSVSSNASRAQQPLSNTGTNVNLLTNTIGQTPELVLNGPNLTGHTSTEGSVTPFQLEPNLSVDVGFGPLLDSAVCTDGDACAEITELDQVLDVTAPAQTSGGNPNGDTNSDEYASPAQPAIGPVILPAKPSQLNDNIASEKKMTPEEEKELRRKLRNRESAARSNLKKQKRMADLKKNIADQKELADRLRARLLTLRKENNALQELVAALGDG